MNDQSIPTMSETAPPKRRPPVWVWAIVAVVLVMCAMCALGWGPDMLGRPLFITGSKIAFSTNEDGYDIFVMDANGSGKTKLTNSPVEDNSPVWSPDGRRIAFSSNRQIAVMNADGSGVTQLTNDTSDDPLIHNGYRYPTWSPDGKRIAFGFFLTTRQGEQPSDIYVMDDDGSNQTRLTDSPADDTAPAWSPDGTQIAFVSDSMDNNGPYGSDIWVMNADGSNPIQLTSSLDAGLSPAWSPDGKRIAFASDGQIYVMNADGSGQVRLTNNRSTDTDPSWSPDGKQIAFTSYRNSNPGIYVMNADGSNVYRLTPINDLCLALICPGAFGPAWSPK